MPKTVDHDQRRREISSAVAHIATTEGVQAVSFRDVAAEAGVSVALVQHYFGTKETLLITSLNLQSERIAELVGEALAALGPDATPWDRVRVVASAFIPTDDESRSAMVLYLGFAGAALTDPGLRGAEAFRRGETLIDFFSDQLQLAADRGEVVTGVDPRTQARALLSMVLGLVLAVLLEQTPSGEALGVLNAQLALMKGRVPGPSD